MRPIFTTLHDQWSRCEWNPGINLPHVFKPILEKNNNGDVFIVGYLPVNSVTGPNDPQLDPRYVYDVTQLAAFPPNIPLLSRAGAPINVYGVPWIIGAKKNLPGFEQYYLLNEAQVTRKMQVSRTSGDPATATYYTNQMYVVGISNNLGISFWNSYYTAYPRPLTVYASDVLTMGLTNRRQCQFPHWPNQFYLSKHRRRLLTGQDRSGVVPQPNASSFLNLNWTFNFLKPAVYRYWHRIVGHGRFTDRFAICDHDSAAAGIAANGSRDHELFTGIYFRWCSGKLQSR